MFAAESCVAILEQLALLYSFLIVEALLDGAHSGLAAVSEILGVLSISNALGLLLIIQTIANARLNL